MSDTMTDRSPTKALIDAARAVCPICDVGLFGDAAGHVESSAEVLAEAADAYERASAPDWHRLNREARMRRAGARLQAARERHQRTTARLAELTADWTRGESHFAHADRSSGYSGPC